MAMSKVSRPQSFSWLVPREADSEIQVVLQEEGSGSKAEALAWEIMKDIHSQGNQRRRSREFKCWKTAWKFQRS